MPNILSFKGLSMSDFSSQEEAFKVADEIIAANKVEFEHDGAATTPFWTSFASCSQKERPGTGAR